MATKKCCIYAAFGVLQTPNDWILEKEIKLEDVLHEKRFTSKHIAFSGEAKITDAESQNLEVNNFNYILKLPTLKMGFAP